MQFSEIKNRLKTKSIGIAGCGGLGSNAAVSLARIGVGRLVIADFDRIEETNLNRQYFFLDQIGEYKVKAIKANISRINPTVKVQEHVIKLDENNIADLFESCDVIIEAFDKAEMKEMLIETIQTELPAMPVISGVGMSGWGKNETIKTSKYNNLYLIGDNEIEATEETPPLAPRVCIVSNMMANLAIEILLGEMK